MAYTKDDIEKILNGEATFSYRGISTQPKYSARDIEQVLDGSAAFSYRGISPKKSVISGTKTTGAASAAPSIPQYQPGKNNLLHPLVLKPQNPRRFTMPLRTDVDIDKARKVAADATRAAKRLKAKPVVSPSGMIGNTGIRLPSAQTASQRPSIGNTGVRLPVVEKSPEYKGALVVPNKPEGVPMQAVGNMVGALGRGFLYGTERLGQGVLRAAEGVNDYVGALGSRVFGMVSSNMGTNSTPISEGLNDYAKFLLDTDVSGGYGESIEKRHNPTESMRMVGNLNEAGGAMLPAIASGGAAASTAVIGAQAAGNAAAQAYQDGASLDQSLLYGTTSGLLEATIERISGGIAGLPEGAVTGMVKRVMDSPVAGKLVDILGEGGEEALSTFLDPYLRRAIYDGQAQNATPQEIADSAIAGIALSLVTQASMGGADYLARRKEGGGSLLDQLMIARDGAAGYNQAGGDFNANDTGRTEGTHQENIGADLRTDDGRGIGTKSRATETTGEFLRRANEESREIQRRGEVAYSLKPVKDENFSPAAKAIYDDLVESGLETIIIDGPLERHVGNETIRDPSDGVTAVDGTVYIRNDTGQPPMVLSGHEKSHGAAKKFPEIYRPYSDSIFRDNLNLSDPDFSTLADTLIEKHFPTVVENGVERPFDLTVDYPKLFNELEAVFGGHINGDRAQASELFSNWFSDWGRTVAAWDQMNEALRRNAGGGTGSQNLLDQLKVERPQVEIPNVEPPKLRPDDPVMRSINEAHGLGGESVSASTKRPAGPRKPVDNEPEERIAQVLTETPYSKESLREQAGKTYDFLNRKLVDSGHTIARVGKVANDPTLYHLYNSAKQSRAQANYAIGGQGVLGAVGAQTDLYGNIVGKSLYDIFEPVRRRGEEYHREFGEYLFHMHNIDRMSIEARAASDPELASVLAEIRNKPVFGESVTAEISAQTAAELAGKHPEFERLAQEVYGYNRNLMQYRVDTGLVSQEQAELMDRLYPHYVPTYRDNRRAATSGARGTDSAVKINVGIKRAKGSNLNLLPIADQMATQTTQTYAAGRRNLFGTRLLDDAIRNQEKLGAYIHSAAESAARFDLDSPSADLGKTFTVYREGKAVEMEVNPGIFDGVKALASETGEHNNVMKAVVGANNTFKKLVTGYNPFFLGRNFARDLQDAGLYSKDLAAFARNYPKAWKEMASNGPLWQRYQALGGFGSSFLDYDRGLKQNRSKVQRFSVDAIENLNMMIEQAPRFAEFLSTVEKGGTSYENLMQAMYDSADVTVNFGRSGSWGKTLNRTFVPFFNPSIQGASKTIRRFTETKGVKEWTTLIIRAVALGIVPALINSLLLEDDKDYQIITQREKDTNYLFKVGDGLFVKIPRGRVLSLFGMGSDAFMRIVRGQDVDWAGFISTASSQVLPTNPFTGNIASQFLGADLFNPDSSGQTWYGSPIEGMRLQNIKDPAMRYDEKTDLISRWIGKQTGVSPKKINYVLDSYSGVLGDFLLPALTPQAERNPLMNAFTIDTTLQNNLSERFYDAVDHVTRAKQAQEGKDYNDITGRFLSRQNGLVSDFYEEIREIEASSMTDAEKKVRVRRLREELNSLQQDTLEILPAFEAAAKTAYTGSTDQKIDQAYFDANRKVFGAEHALRAYNKDVYAKAQSLNGKGISYDLFADIYLAQKQLREKYEDFEGDESRATKMATEFSKYLDGLGLDDKRRAIVDDAFKFYNMYPAQPQAYRYGLLGDSAKEKYQAFREAKSKGFYPMLDLDEQEFTRIMGAVKGCSKKQEKIDALVAAGYSYMEANQIYNVIK